MGQGKAPKEGIVGANELAVCCVTAWNGCFSCPLAWYEELQDSWGLLRGGLPSPQTEGRCHHVRLSASIP